MAVRLFSRFWQTPKCFLNNQQSVGCHISSRSCDCCTSNSQTHEPLMLPPNSGEKSRHGFRVCQELRKFTPVNQNGFSPVVMSRGILDLTYPLYNFFALDSIHSRVSFDLAARRNIRNTQNIDDVLDVSDVSPSVARPERTVEAGWTVNPPAGLTGRPN